MEENEPQSNNGNKKVITAFVLLLAIVLVVAGVAMFGKKDTAEDTAATTSTTSQPTTAESAADANASQESGTTDSGTSSSSYKDGTYSATGSYMTPGGQQQIGVTVTLKDGSITETSLQQTAENKQTQEYQGKFASGYKPLVVGKKIDEIKLSRVSGSSLTSQGFGNALEDIAKKAQEQS